MLELIAQGSTIDQRWRRQLPLDAAIRLGRATESFRVPWDAQISRSHVKILAQKHRAKVVRDPDATNPVFFEGHEVDEFVLSPGQHFVIGNTTFLLTEDQAFGSMSAPSPFSQKTFSSDFLQQVKYRDADRRIEVLNRLPDVIAEANDTDELLTSFLNTLMAGIVSATSIGIISTNSIQEKSPGEQPSRLTVIHWDRRGLERGDFQPSETLIMQAIEGKESVLNLWQPTASESEEYTFDYEHDWAFASPISSEATPGWAIYVAGRNRDPSGSTTTAASVEALDLDGDIKFCELVGSTLKNLMQVQRLERQQASLRNFFSPIVMDSIRSRSAEDVLAPTECDVTVLFCDLRGFAKTSEAMADDLMELLERVSESLGITTRAILDKGGVIGDFHGDSVMGFWGWPLECALSDNAHQAVAAALDIQKVFEKHRQNHPRFENFHVGLGLASGHAVAGKIGTREQVKVTVFGPVVNLAARLEGMTRPLNSMILADQSTVERLLPSEDSKWRARRLGKFLPYGLTISVDVYQVLDSTDVSQQQIDTYHTAIRHYEQNELELTRQLLQRLPQDDSARRFLEAWIASRPEPDSAFDGTFRMSKK